MEKLDQAYLTNLVSRAQQGSSNAFAELFAAVYTRHYAYLSFLFTEEQKVMEAMKQVYARILNNLPALSGPVFYMPWSLRICYRCYLESREHEIDDHQVVTPAGRFRLLQLLTLPVAESQILVMRYEQNLPLKEIAGLLNYDTGFVKRCLKTGIRHLQKGTGKEIAETLALQEHHLPQHLPKQTAAMAAADILDYAFESCGKDPNTVPLEALSAYAVYRKERFSLQRGILIAAIIVFLLLPALFFLPQVEIRSVPVGERGLPVYSVYVRSILPVGKVTAKIRNHNLPVYEADVKAYTIEPIRNGNMTVHVELINKQSVEEVVEVSDVDAEGPRLVDSSTDPDTVALYVNDAGIGVDYREIYAMNKNGEVYYPLQVDEGDGKIVFAYPDSDWDVYIPDHIGNLLHLTFTFV